MVQEDCSPHIFKDGTTNGAAWFDGGMQDYNYLYSNCMEITVEQGCCKFSSEEELDGEWDKNKLAMIRFLMQVHQGIMLRMRMAISFLALRLLSKILGKTKNFTSQTHKIKILCLECKKYYSLLRVIQSYFGF